MVLHAVGAGIAFLSFSSLCVFHTYLQVRWRAVDSDSARRFMTVISSFKTRPTDRPVHYRSTRTPSTDPPSLKTQTPTGHRPRDLRLDPLQAHARHRHHHRAAALHRHHDRRRHRTTTSTSTSSSTSHQQQQQWRGAGEGGRACGGQYPASGPGGGGVDRDGGGRGRGGDHDDGIV